MEDKSVVGGIVAACKGEEREVGFMVDFWKPPVNPVGLVSKA